jgi:hypothetical protein
MRHFKYDKHYERDHNPNHYRRPELADALARLSRGSEEALVWNIGGNCNDKC